MIAADAADEFGWKPQKITEVLVQTGDINLGQHEYQAEKKLVLDRAASTVGRSIRRMRKADEERRAKLTAEKRGQRTADRAALKGARLLKVARARLINCLVRRMRPAGSVSIEPIGSNSSVIIGIRRFGKRGAVLTFKEYFPGA
jgi:hypothetical protein